MIRGIIILGLLGTAVLLVVIIAALVGVLPSGDPLMRPAWAWRATTTAPSSPPPAPSPVPDPARYTVSFLAKGNLVVTADCVTLGGQWHRMLPGRTGPLTRLTITLPASSPDCGPSSLASTFIDDLRQSASYRIQDDRLTIILAGDERLLFDPLGS
jgi:hypothetical protein